jgi:hypothetical protein
MESEESTSFQRQFPFRGSQATPDMMAMAATHPQIGVDHLYSSQVRALNQSLGPRHQIYPQPRAHQPVTRSDGAYSASMDPTRLVATYSGDSSPQVLQEIMPQSMPHQTLTQWPREGVLHGISGSEQVARM